ncbi:MAG TPA: sodium/solute symporter [Steroidobacteraceae bacterium]|nr:sodium/solute symporter [Steroidobacteraceae bacterium]
MTSGSAHALLAMTPAPASALLAATPGPAGGLLATTPGAASGLLATIDWVVIAVYAGGLVLLGLAMSRRGVGPADYFLASRTARWPVIGLALFATNMSSTALVGLAGGAYAVGISVYDYEWSATLILVFLCVFLLPYIIRSRTYTMPEFLERRYDRRARLYFALLTLFLNVFVDSAGVLYSGALVCRLIFPGWPLWLIVTLLATAAGMYTTLGGLRAVIYTEAVQGIVLVAGALLIAVGAFHRAGGWNAVMHGVDPAALSLIRPIGDPGVPWPGLAFGIPLLGFYYWCTNQSIVQRMLAAQSIDQARWGALLAGLLKLPVLFLMVLPGICALLLFPGLPRADLVYPSLILKILPAGLVGLVVAGFVAATMVSIASMLNSASTLMTMDVVRQLHPRLSDAQVVRIGRLMTALLLVIAIAWAPELQRFTSLWQYLQGALAYAVPPVVALFVLGLFWRGAEANGAAAAMVLGSAAGLALFLINGVFGWTHIHFLYVAPILTVFDVSVLVVVSRFHRAARSAATRADAGSVDAARAAAAIGWHGAPPELSAAPVRRPLWQDYRMQAAVLVALTAAIVIAFR